MFNNYKLLMNRLGMTSCVVAVALAVSPISVQAVGTRRFVLEGADSFSKGTLEGTSVDSWGKLVTGPQFDEIALPKAVTAWVMLKDKDGSLLVGSASEGTIYRAKKGEEAKSIGKVGGFGVSAGTYGKNGEPVFATFGEGSLYRIENGQPKLWVSLEAEHIWALAYDAQARVFFAATGPDGKLFRISEDGRATVYFDAEESHLSALALCHGHIFVGTGDESRLIEVSAVNQAEVIHDFALTEVRQIACADGGRIAVVANQLPVGDVVGRNKSATHGKESGSLFEVTAEREVATLFESENEAIVHMQRNSHGSYLLGTGKKAQLIEVAGIEHHRLLTEHKARQLTAVLGNVEDGSLVVLSNDPVSLFWQSGAKESLWTSTILDLGILGKFGKLSASAKGRVDYSVRTGNTANVSPQWSQWSAWGGSERLNPQPARFLQVRVRLTGDASLSRLEIPFVTQNLQHAVTQVEIEEKVESAKSGKIESSGGPTEMKHSAVRAISWKVNNPDKDELVYRLHYRIEGFEEWVPLQDANDPITAANYKFDTAQLPEGRYQVRVSASDELANPEGNTKTSSADSDWFLVDNTPPVLSQLSYQNGRLRVRASDGVGPITRIEVSSPRSKLWWPVVPVDGVFDEATELVDSLLPKELTEDTAWLSVRVYDAAGNFLVRPIGTSVGSKN